MRKIMKSEKTAKALMGLVLSHLISSGGALADPPPATVNLEALRANSTPAALSTITEQAALSAYNQDPMIVEIQSSLQTNQVTMQAPTATVLHAVCTDAAGTRCEAIYLITQSTPDFVTVQVEDETGQTQTGKARLAFHSIVYRSTVEQARINSSGLGVVLVLPQEMFGFIAYVHQGQLDFIENSNN